jgi:hypothetical protein
VAGRHQQPHAAAGGILQKTGADRHQQALQPEVVRQMFAKLKKGRFVHDGG